MSVMNFIKQIPTLAYAIVAGTIALFPEFTLDKFGWFNNLCGTFNCIDRCILILLCKLAFFIIICAIVALIVLIYKKNIVTREFILDNSIIMIKPGDLLDEADQGVAVVSFDECFTCDVGIAIHQVNQTSICGQFINKYPNVGEFIKNMMAEVLPTEKSLYNNLPAYPPGYMIPYGENYLLMVLAKLDRHGSAVTTRIGYIISLLNIWQNINLMYAQRDVYVPIFGSGTLRFSDGDITQQQLLDIMLMTYEMMPNKIKQPNKLIIVYQKKDNFSVWKIRNC